MLLHRIAQPANTHSHSHLLLVAPLLHLCLLLSGASSWYVFNVPLCIDFFCWRLFPSLTCLTIFKLPFWTDAFGSLKEGEGRAIDGNTASDKWMGWWTVFYMAWWVAWSCFVGCEFTSLSNFARCSRVMLRLALSFLRDLYSTVKPPPCSAYPI